MRNKGHEIVQDAILKVIVSHAKIFGGIVLPNDQGHELGMAGERGEYVFSSFVVDAAGGQGQAK